MFPDRACIEGVLPSQTVPSPCCPAIKTYKCVFERIEERIDQLKHG